MPRCATVSEKRSTYRTARDIMTDASTISLGLVSHTNAGKTTLARTLLRRDIGEIGDRAHVTDVSERHVLIDSPEGDVLVLWDTPGFGDSMRLYTRLKQNQDPIAWVLGQSWDRSNIKDRPYWSGQQAIRTVSEHCDLVLYVINAAESPEEAPYIGSELQILEWIGKPVLLLLNQVSSQRNQARTEADMALWRAHLTGQRCVKGILTLDAFARCWVQEGTLLAQVPPLLASTLQPSAARLQRAWHARNLSVFERSMQVVASQVASVAVDEEVISRLDLQQRVRGWVAGAIAGEDRSKAHLVNAQRALATRRDEVNRTAIDMLIQLHGLSGRAASEPLQALAEELAVEEPLDEHKASLLGGLLSGAAGGVAADLAVGGLSFGAGALIGGVLGALGARGATQAYNIARKREQGRVRWSAAALNQQLGAALLGYLAVAHFGRGRGEFVRAVVPEPWQQALSVIARKRAALDEIWSAARPGERDATERPLLGVIRELSRDVLTALYPNAREALNPTP